MKMYIEAGEFVGVHGINGELKLYPWCDDVSFFDGIKKIYIKFNNNNNVCEKSYVLKKAHLHKNIILIQLEDIDTVEKARQLVSEVLYVNRKDIKLKKGRYLIQDMIGLKVVDANTNEEYGVIKDISRPANCDIYTIETKNGDVLFPAVPKFIDEISIEKNQITIKPIEGMFNE